MVNRAQPSPPGGRLAQWLARARVPLGFVFAAAVVWLAHPTFRSLATGGIVALAGELIRIWAAGHLEKGREITRSGPYRLTCHPLYAGSALIGVGVAIASARWMVAMLVSAYLLSTILAAVRHEEANMRTAFPQGPDGADGRAGVAGYDGYAYGRSQTVPVNRAFSLQRALRNK